MPALSSERLASKLTGCLDGASRIGSEDSRPIVLGLPGVGAVRIYIWTITQDRSSRGRPPGEHKIQIILPDARPRSTQHLDLEDMPTFILGYSPVFGVFSAWEARRHHSPRYSANLQVRETLLRSAAEDGWAIDEPRTTQSGPEVRAAAHPIHLKRLLSAFIEADDRSLSGPERKNFLEARSPWRRSLAEEERRDEEVSQNDLLIERNREIFSRVARDRVFSPKVLESHGWSCAVCGVQLSIVEAAHIIPAHHERGVDEIWNGLALCPNHHRLFDRHIYVIDARGYLQIDEETVGMLEGLHRLEGFSSLLEPFAGRPLRGLPAFFEERSESGVRMREAFGFMCRLTGMG